MKQQSLQLLGKVSAVRVLSKPKAINIQGLIQVSSNEFFFGFTGIQCKLSFMKSLEKAQTLFFLTEGFHKQNFYPRLAISIELIIRLSVLKIAPKCIIPAEPAG